MIQCSACRARPSGVMALLPVAVLFAVTAEAAAPRISGVPVTSTTVGQPYSFTPIATDPDGNRLTFSIANRPAWASFSTTTGELRGSTFAEHAKVWSGIVISVSDGSSTVALPAWSLTVKPSSNKSPTLSGTPASAARVGTAYSFQPTATDPEGRALTFSIRNKPAWATFSTSTGRLSGTPTAPGTTSSIMIIATDGVTSASLQPAFSIAVSGSVVASNAAPTITGSPMTTAQVGRAYSFTPTVSDANGDALTFSVQNKPSWATFNTITGQLSGTPLPPASPATNIRIHVSDGKVVSSLPAFSVAVAPGPPGSNRAVMLSWIPPAENTDGSALTDLAGYRIWYGKNASDLSSVITINNVGIASYLIDGLVSGVWYFAMSSLTSAGAESENSALTSAILH